MTAKIIKYTKDYIFIDIEVQLGYFKFKNITIAHF